MGTMKNTVTYPTLNSSFLAKQQVDFREYGCPIGPGPEMWKARSDLSMLLADWAS